MRAFTICLAALVAAPLMALAAAQAQMPSFSLSVDVASSFVAGSNGRVLHERPVAQTNLRATWGNGLYVNLWGSKSLSGLPSRYNFGNEIDYSIGYNGEFRGFHFTMEANYFDVSAPNLFQSQGDVIKFIGEIRHPFKLGDHKLTPFVGVEPTFPVGVSARGGTYWYAGAAHDWDFNPWLSLSHSLRVIYDGGAYDAQRGFIARYDAALTFRFSDSVSVSVPKIRFIKTITPFSDGRRDVVVFGAGTRVTF